MLSLSGAPKLEMSDYVTDSHSSGETHFVDKMFQMGKNKLVQMYKKVLGSVVALAVAAIFIHVQNYLIPPKNFPL